MTTSRTALDDLTPGERSELERRLVPFDLHWRAEELRRAIDRLPPEARWRWAAVVEMVKVDLEQRWHRGERPDLAEYVRAVPELGGAGELPAHLIHAEYQVRKQFGVPADLDEYARQYPRQADELRAIAGRAAATVAYSGAGGVPPVPDTAVMSANEVRVRQLASGGDPNETWEQPIAFGRYSIIRLLGRGGMGTVYLAHDPRLEREVALKIPSAEMTSNRRASDLMMREARAVAGLHHPNICPVYDIGVADGVPFITSHFIDGEPLSAVVRRAPPVSEAKAVKLVATVARALDYAHESGIVHRDLKPSNVMLDRTGNPVVMDFGLARRVRPNEPNRGSATALAGSPAYMAPEQVAEARTGPASDVYSLGVVLFEVLTGRVPFEGSVADVLQKVVHDPAPPPSRFRRGLDPDLDAVCRKAMAKRTEDRYRTMAEFAAALEALEGDRRRGVGRAVALTAAGVLVAAAAAAWAFSR